MKAAILCAGLGTRLRPLTDSWPKPAIPLLGQPLIRYCLAMLKRAGVNAIAINTHHLGAAMAATAADECRRARLALEVVHEPLIQGTGGGIRGLRRWIEDPCFLVVNGDALFSFDLRALIEEHRRSNADATLALMPMPPGGNYAAVETDAAGRVWRIAGKGAEREGLQPRHFPGVHVLTPAVFDFISPSGPEDINRDVYPRMIQNGRMVRGAAVDGYWSDVGTAGRYLQTQSDLLSGRVPLDAFADGSPFFGAQLTKGGYWTRDNAQVGQSEVHAPAFFDSGSTIASSAKLGPNVYVGRGAQVGPSVELVEAAVLENTVLAANQRLIKAIAWGKGRLNG